MAEVVKGVVNICLQCDYSTRLNKGAEVHSKEKRHLVIQDMAPGTPLTKEWIVERRKFLKDMRDGMRD